MGWPLTLASAPPPSFFHCCCLPRLLAVFVPPFVPSHFGRTNLVFSLFFVSILRLYLLILMLMLLVLFLLVRLVLWCFVHLLGSVRLHLKRCPVSECWVCVFQEVRLMIGVVLLVFWVIFRFLFVLSRRPFVLWEFYSFWLVVLLPLEQRFFYRVTCCLPSDVLFLDCMTHSMVVILRYLVLRWFVFPASIPL